MKTLHTHDLIMCLVSGSSCDDVHKASRKLQTFAKKSIRRDKKKEKEKQERKEKSKFALYALLYTQCIMKKPKAMLFSPQLYF